MREKRPEFAVLAGDLNSLSSVDAATYAESKLTHILNEADHVHKPRDAKYREKFAFEGKLDYRILDTLYQAGFVDGRGKQEFVSSVPTRLSTSHDWMNNEHTMRLDYVLVTPALASHITSCQAVQDDSTHKLSDHYPVLCKFA